MKRHPFSMVEILLALGVVAIGICSVMVLFPVGAAATRDASMETYAANAADQILHMVKYNLTRTDAGNQWFNYICKKPADSTNPADPDGQGIFSGDEPDYSEIEDINIDDTDKWKDFNVLLGGNTLRSGIFPMDGHDDHFYQIIVHRGDTNDSFTTVLNDNVVDFRALATLWATKVEVPGTPLALPLNFATRLNLKIEWPIELPHEARQSALYTLEVFNNN